MQGKLKVLKHVAMLGHVAHPGHFIFILNAVRQAATETLIVHLNGLWLPITPKAPKSLEFEIRSHCPPQKLPA